MPPPRGCACHATTLYTRIESIFSCGQTFWKSQKETHFGSTVSSIAFHIWSADIRHAHALRTCWQARTHNARAPDNRGLAAHVQRRFEDETVRLSLVHHQRLRSPVASTRFLSRVFYLLGVSVDGLGCVFGIALIPRAAASSRLAVATTGRNPPRKVRTTANPSVPGVPQTTS